MIKTLGLEKKLWNETYVYLMDEAILSKKKKYSEHGEELVIESVFSKIKPQNKFCVDVGAWGVEGSNTFKLIEEGWNALLLEAMVGKVDEYKIVLEKYPKAKILRKFVTPGRMGSPHELDCLEVILKENEIPENFDLLDIDVDGTDFEIWRNLVSFNPNLVCIECNQGEMDMDVIDYDSSFCLYQYNGKPGTEVGATVGLLNRLAEQKGYDYLCWDVSNAFYIRKGFVNG